MLIKSNSQHPSNNLPMNYSLGNKIGEGGEGTIYDVLNSPYSFPLVAKIYKTIPEVTLQNKLRLMAGYSHYFEKHLPHVSWALDVLSNENNQVIGYVMRKHNVAYGLSEIWRYNPEYRNCQFSYRQRVVIAQNICDALNEVHNQGIIFGDFNPGNIGITSEGYVCFFDADSYHLREKKTGVTHRCVVSFDGYVAPELLMNIRKFQRTNPSSQRQLAEMPLETWSYATDNFALATYVFQLLMNGLMPHSGMPSPSGGSRPTVHLDSPQHSAVFNDNYCFKPNRTPPDPLPRHTAFPPYICLLFERAFVLGRNNPNSRPKANEWLDALNRYSKELASCGKNQFHHYHVSSGMNCPYCEVDAKYHSPIVRPTPQPNHFADAAILELDDDILSLVDDDFSGQVIALDDDFSLAPLDDDDW